MDLYLKISAVTGSYYILRMITARGYGLMVQESASNKDSI